MITLKQIEQEHGIGRSSLHTYRRRPTFPQPVPVEGSTKIVYRADEVAAWFEANPPSQGKRTDLAPTDEGAPMQATEQASTHTTEGETSQEQRLAVMLSYQAGIAAQKVGLPEERADELARAVVRAVYETAAGWSEAQDG